MRFHRRRRVRSFWVASGVVIRRLPVAALLALLVHVTLPAQVQPLGHPTVEERIAAVGLSPDDGFRFVVFGDQKNLWKDDFPRLLDQVRAEADSEGLLFMLDTGDIVDDGSKDEQFEGLRAHLAPVADLPYLVSVGNHELQPERGVDVRSRAHQNTATFLGADYVADRMFFTKQIGPVRLLFLNTSDLPGVYPDLHDRDAAAEARAVAQLQWLERELRTEVHPTIALSHHALVQSASKHRDHANALWNHVYDDHDGRTLPEILVDGGVDLVLSGHVHSFEVFKLERNGRQMWSVNASGRPTGFWFSGSRMPSNWQGRELDRLDDAGFKTRLDEWKVAQLAFMTDDTKRDQFALAIVDAAGQLQIEIRDVDGTVLYSLPVLEGTS